MMDNTERYRGKEVSFIASVLIPDKFVKGMFIPGRKIMTCCAEDIQFLGFPCKYGKCAELSNKQWVKVTAKVNIEYFEGYKGEGPVLEAISVESCKAPKNDVITF